MNRTRARRRRHTTGTVEPSRVWNAVQRQPPRIVHDFDGAPPFAGSQCASAVRLQVAITRRARRQETFVALIGSREKKWPTTSRPQLRALRA